MKIPFLDLKTQTNLITEEIQKRFSRIIQNTAFVSGKGVSDFENQFANMHDVEYTLGLSSGTDGNHLAMISNGIGNGDEVLVPVNTFIATAEGISHSGAKPVFIDIDEKTYNIDTSKIEQAINERTKAINPVHLYGQSSDMDQIIEIAIKNNLIIIEDASQAHLAEYKNKKVGTFGVMASWSFYPGKNLGAWGEAGAISTNNQKLFEKANKLRSHGSEKKYYHDLIGHNYRMSEFMAEVLNVKMKYIEKWTNQRRSNAKKYFDRLKDIEGIILPYELPNTKHVFHLYVIRVKERDSLIKYLNEKGVSTGIHYPFPLHMTGAYKYLGYKKGSFPIAEKTSKEILSLPMYPELSNDQIDYVCENIRSFFNNQ
jgi:dTDP-4-amino-4,6-dideoxygalactose transaminase